MTQKILLGCLITFVAVCSAHAQEPLEDKFFNSAGVRIRYVEKGHGEAVVLIHGFGLSLDLMWQTNGVIDELSQDFHVVAIDARGHGKSDKPHDPAKHGIQMVEDITRLLDHLKLNKAHIVGYSMGAGIAGKFAAIHPDRVSTIVFGGGAPRFWTAEEERMAIATAESLEQGKGLRPLILAVMSKKEPPPSEEEIDKISGFALSINDPLALAAVQRSYHQQKVAPEDLKSLRMPMIAIIGDKDPGKVKVEDFKILNPELEVFVIDGAAHLGAVRRPEFVTKVHEFLITHSATSDRITTPEL